MRNSSIASARCVTQFHRWNSIMRLKTSLFCCVASPGFRCPNTTAYTTALTERSGWPGTKGRSWALSEKPMLAVNALAVKLEMSLRAIAPLLRGSILQRCDFLYAFDACVCMWRCFLLAVYSELCGPCSEFDCATGQWFLICVVQVGYAAATVDILMQTPSLL